MKNIIETVLTVDGSKFKTKLEGYEKTALKFSAAVGAVAVGTLALAKQTANLYDETIKSARAAGTTTEAFSAMAHAADMSGVSSEQLQKALAKLSGPTKGTTEALAKLGISAKNVDGSFKDSNQIMTQLSQSISKMESPTMKTAAAVSVLGEEGSKMVSFLDSGEEGLKAFTLQAELMGKVVSTQAAVAAEKFNDDISVLTGSIGGLTNQVGSAVIQFVNQTGIIETLSGIVQSVTAAFNGLSDSTKNIIITVGAVATGIAALVPILIGAKAAFAALAGSMMLNPVALAIVGTIAAVTLLGVTVIKYWDQIKAVTAPLIKYFDTLKLSVQPISKFISDIFSKVTEMGSGADDSGRKISILGTTAKIIFGAIATFIFVNVEGLRLLARTVQTVIESVADLGRAFEAGMRWDFDVANAALARVRNSVTNLGGEFRNFGNEIKNQFAELKNPVYEVDDAVKKMTQNTIAANNEIANAGDEAGKKAKEVKTKFQEIKESFQKASKDIAESFKAVGEASTDMMANPSVESVGVMGSAMSNVASIGMEKFNAMFQGIAMMAEVAAESIRRRFAAAGLGFDVLVAKQREANAKEIKETENSEKTKLDALKESEEAKLEELRQFEERRLTQMEIYRNERLLALDGEYQTEKDKREQEFQLFMQRERERFELEKELLDEKSYDREQRLAVSAQMEESWLQYQQLLETQHQSDMLGFQAEYQARIKGEDDNLKLNLQSATAISNASIESATEASNLKLIQAQEDSDKRLEDLRAKKEAEEKRSAKAVSFVKWLGESAAFEATKNVQYVQTIAQGIAGAAQAFSALAPIPFIGPGLGAAAAGVILSASNSAANQIRSARVLPPADLFMRDGGVVRGARHSGGGIPANLEDNEAVIDRVRTQKIQNFVDTGLDGGGVTVIFEEGSIVGNHNFDERWMSDLGQTIEQSVRRRNESMPRVA